MRTASATPGAIAQTKNDGLQGCALSRRTPKVCATVVAAYANPREKFLDIFSK
jgi:hypothetical protein